MVELVTSGYWCVVAESVIGASHIESGLPNQDGVRMSKILGGGGLIVAVADGHGSAKYVRSHVGAQIATAVAVEQMEQLLSLPPKRLMGFHPAELEELVSKHIVRSWTKRIAEHAATEPFTAEESKAAKVDAISAYGSTLLMVAATRNVAVVAQIGDGDLLFVSATGRVTRPLPHDSRILGNETVSLCSPDAVQSMRVRLKSLSSDDAECPRMIFLATDGYANCFKDEAAFTQAACDYASLVKTRNGPRTIRENITGWLRQASDEFSRDDITVAVVYSRTATRNEESATSGRR